MSSHTAPSGEAKAVFKGPDRAEKGSALAMIAAESQARTDKTARLKALRMEREAADEKAAAAAKDAAPAKKPKRVRKAVTA